MEFFDLRSFIKPFSKIFLSPYNTWILFSFFEHPVYAARPRPFTGVSGKSRQLEPRIIEVEFSEDQCAKKR